MEPGADPMIWYLLARDDSVPRLTEAPILEPSGAIKRWGFEGITENLISDPAFFVCQFCRVPEGIPSGKLRPFKRGSLE